MRFEARDNMGKPAAFYVQVHGTQTRREAPIEIEAQSDGRSLGLYLDENHAQALVLALQAAIAEVQARAVSL